MIFTLAFDSNEDRDKFTYLYQTYLRTVYWTIKRIIPNIDEAALEDLSQDTFLKVAENLDKIDLNDSIRTRNYIITIARNFSKNYLRSHEKDAELHLESLENQLPDTVNVLELMVKKEFYACLREEIKNLKESYQTVLELKYGAQMSNDEIACFLNIKKKTVEMQLYRAKMELKKRVKERLYES